MKSSLPRSLRIYRVCSDNLGYEYSRNAPIGKKLVNDLQVGNGWFRFLSFKENLPNRDV
jgi:hypothetical protein